MIPHWEDRRSRQPNGCLDSAALEWIRARAVAARERAYAPYSHFAVGAAVVTSTGRVFTGCNVENASYGLTVCAERAAVFAAATAGERQLVAVAIVTDAPRPTMPCGACRQVLHELGPDMEVISCTLAGGLQRARLSELLPDAFGPSDLAISKDSQPDIQT